ncbi:MAG TPA: adenylate/guanylate cyclase domain-containing protein, partial [candidate division WOR-3 bacterium]|nr:adenylate/guanylate cyclase domain-containing protein [candidate division WOR-3 bacterium]
MKKKNNPFLPVNLSILEDGLQIKRGTLLFADISGFTRMSEHLASFGLEGTEILTEILNEYFDMMLGVVKKTGGDVLKFAGDAVLVEFK